MLGYIWLFFIVTAVIVGGINGRIDQVGQAAIDYSKLAVEISISLIGIMSLWLGLMKLAEASGLILLVSKLIKPLTKRIFPEVPPEHPAMGSIAMNISANALGVTNAATPIGIKAMKELQLLNENKNTATNAMCAFLAINSAGLQLVPASIIGVLIGAGAKNPTVIILPTILASGIALIVGIIAVKVLEKLPVFRMENFSEKGEEPCL
ncbi:MAG TPA: nucleoside recognition domain-containing protein [Candidatus Gastranaerophilales bacterium]|nr:nucleoside recognition domain-containing protein [Candidatus Gastranaerophilales bacterium]